MTIVEQDVYTNSVTKTQQSILGDNLLYPILFSSKSNTLKKPAILLTLGGASDCLSLPTWPVPLVSNAARVAGGTKNSKSNLPRYS